jgi:FdhD protein
LSALVSETPSVTDPASVFDVEQLINSLENMRSQQPGFEATGGMHAAGLMLSEKSDLLIREDIGRHNAVDKVMGAWLESKEGGRPVALLLSGRCGWDIVAKAARMNIPIIASIGAASSLAIGTARSSNMTLVSFAKAGRAVVIGPVQGRIQRNH